MRLHGLYLKGQDGGMLQNKGKKAVGKPTLASLKKQMEPRMSRSARIAKLNLDTGRISEQPSATMSGTVDKIIAASHPRQSEKVQIAVDEADRGFRDLRIENTLTDEHGDDFKLKKGAHVEVSVTAKPNALATAKSK